MAPFVMLGGEMGGGGGGRGQRHVLDYFQCHFLPVALELLPSPCSLSPFSRFNVALCAAITQAPGQEIGQDVLH